MLNSFIFSFIKVNITKKVEKIKKKYN